MKKVVLLGLIAIFSSMAGFAQWSVGLDARLAPWCNERQNYGTDIVVNYQLPIGSFFIMPSAGLFYQRFPEEGFWIVGNYGQKPDIKNEGYRTGFDLTCVFGKQFNLGAGKAAIFTGPRYAYAFASHPEFEEFDPYLQNTFDWRIGVSYSIWKITVSAKADISCLRMYKRELMVDDPHKQPTTLAFGVAYNF